MTWCLVGNTGVLHMLEPSMMFVGRENCEITVQSRSVDKRHSVVNYDQIDDIFAIKDMGSLNGTFVNETRIPEQTYITLQQGDSVRFGYDPVTYRFDQINPNQIRQVKDAQGITRLETYNVEENGNKPAPKAFLDRTSSKQRQNTESAANTDNSRHPYKQKPDMIPSPRGSPLYGQPEWWGEPDVPEVDQGFRLRSGTYDATDKEKRITQETTHTERPTKLPLGDTTRDIPVHIYTKRTDIKPTTPNKQVKTPEHTEVTLVKASDRHVGFTIEFNAKEDSPKMCKKESLQDFVPVTVKNKINENKRMVEGLKAERLSKKGENTDSLQSPTTSPPPTGKKHGRRRSGSNETAANRTKANKSTSGTSKTSRSRQSETMEEGGDAGDNVSETGTYTIESESQEVLDARKRIDEVFGINGSVEDGERGSEEDTDKDISDVEIEEEAITKDVVSLQHARFTREEHGSSPEAEHQSNAFVAQWTQDAADREETVEDSSGTTPSNSTVIKNDHSPPEKEPSSPGKASSNHRQSTDNVSNYSSSSRRSGKGRRMLPTTPVERQEQNESPRQNGLHPSQGSAFHSPRDGEEPVKDNQISSRNGGLSYTPRRAPMAPGLQQPRPPNEPRNSWEREGSVDTEVLLKDTETFMKSLEKKMKTKSRESPSPEPDVSEAHDLSHRDFDGDVDTDLESASHVSVVGKGLYTKRGSTGNVKSRTSLPTKQEQKPEKSDSKGKSGKSEQPRKNTIWSRLSQPNKHKRSATASDKETSHMSDNQSDSEGVFHRNTSLTGSLPIGRGSGLKAPGKQMSSSSKNEKKESKKASSKSKPKADLSKPRQTRSTMLRKSRFGEKDSTQDQSDISPTSSISDLSSSKSAPYKRYSSRDTNKSSSKTSRSKPVQSKVDYSRARPSAGSTSRGGSDTSSLGSQIARQARSQSVREGRAHAGETSSRVMSKIASSKQSSSSRRSSVSSTDGTPASNVRKTSSSSWRRYQGGESDNDAVDAYIQTVTSRRTASSSSYDDNKAKSSSMHNLTNHKQGQQASVQAAGKLGDEIAHVSSSLAQSLQRLTKMTQGDTGAEAALESLPKEEKVMDELFSEDTVFIPKSQSQTSANVPPPGEEDGRGSRLQRASSLSLYPDDNLAQAIPNQMTGGSPPVALKHKHWGKTNESFDNLVLSSVNHLSLKLKDSSDRIAYKLKYLQYPNASEDELADAVKESDFALLKTGNKEIASILRNMRQMEKRLTDIHAMIDPRNEIQLPRELSPAAQIRRKYIGEYGNVSTASATTTTIGLKSPSATSPRHNWQKKSPTSGGRSVFSDGEDVEVYL